MSGEDRHQGVVAQIDRTTTLDEAGLRTRVEAQMEEGSDVLLLMLEAVEGST